VATLAVVFILAGPVRLKQPPVAAG